MSLFVAIGPNVREDPAEGREGQRRNVVFSEPTKLLLTWKEMLERARKIAHNSSVKIEATTGREMSISKNSSTTHTLTKLGTIHINGRSRGVTCAYSKA